MAQVHEPATARAAVIPPACECLGRLDAYRRVWDEIRDGALTIVVNLLFIGFFMAVYTMWSGRQARAQRLLDLERNMTVLADNIRTIVESSW
jgi:hypothetical protein